MQNRQKILNAGLMRIVVRLGGSSSLAFFGGETHAHSDIPASADAKSSAASTPTPIPKRSSTCSKTLPASRPMLTGNTRRGRSSTGSATTRFNFQPRVWTVGQDRRVMLKSEIAVAVDKSLEEAGIGIQ